MPGQFGRCKPSGISERQERQMEEKLFDSEREVMEVIWEEDGITAREVARILSEKTGWNKNTTYTVIKKCIRKGWVERREPGFMCHALISREQARRNDTEEFVNRVFGGSVPLLFSALLSEKKMSKEEIAHLKQMIDEME